MSIRSALVVAMVAAVILPAAILGVLGIRGIDKNVIREAQSRVDHDLQVVDAVYQRRLELLAERLETHARAIGLDQPDLPAHLQRLKRDLDFTTLNLCDAKGKPLAGGYAPEAGSVPVDADSVLRRALLGEVAWGTVLLDSDRLALEGGPALQTAVVVRQRNTSNDSSILTTDALFWWVGAPVRDASGRIVALLYGGQVLNFNYALVDELRALVFGSETHDGKPLGTVTLFLRGIRVATNVLGPDRTRAVGTRVSADVEREVLQLGRPWSDRALVVDA